MKQRSWANPNQECFSPTAYTLDLKKVWDLRVEEIWQSESGREEVETTIGQVLKSLKGHQIVDIEMLFGLRIQTDSQELVLDGPSFNMDLLEALIRLYGKGVEIYECEWLWYDCDSCREKPNRSYSFFIVHGDQIVTEEIAVHDSDDSGFDPSIFKGRDEKKDIWFNTSAWREARVVSLYRKFYRETRKGRLMVFRPDEPELHYYGEGRWAAISLLCFADSLG